MYNNVRQIFHHFVTIVVYTVLIVNVSGMEANDGDSISAEVKYVFFNGHIRNIQNKNLKMIIEFYCDDSDLIDFSTDKNGKFEMLLEEQIANIFKNCINGKNIFIAFTKKNKSAADEKKNGKLKKDAEEIKQNAENEIKEKIFVKIHSPTQLKFGEETFTNEQIRKKFDVLFESKHKIFFANESDENKFLIDFENKSVKINGQETENVTEQKIMNNTTPIIDMLTNDEVDDSASEYDTSSTSFKSKELTKNSSKATSSADDGPETPSSIRQLLANDALASQSGSPVKKMRKAWKKINIFRKKQKDKAIEFFHGEENIREIFISENGKFKIPLSENVAKIFVDCEHRKDKIGIRFIKINKPTTVDKLINFGNFKKDTKILIFKMAPFKLLNFDWGRKQKEIFDQTFFWIRRKLIMQSLLTLNQKRPK